MYDHSQKYNHHSANHFFVFWSLGNESDLHCIYAFVTLPPPPFPTERENNLCIVEYFNSIDEFNRGIIYKPH